MYRWLLKPLLRPLLWALRRRYGRRRVVFSVRVNGRRRYWDPTQVQEELHRLNPKWGELVDAAVRFRNYVPPDQLAEAASTSSALADLVTGVFGIPALRPDGTGMTRAERIAVLACYLTLCAEQVERAEGRPVPDPDGPRYVAAKSEGQS
jgi:hypothetical protein